jgi:hypothetical protein
MRLARSVRRPAGPQGATGHVSAGQTAPAGAGDGGPPAGARSRALRPRTWAATAVWVLGVAAAFACYLRLAWTRAVDSDGASNALQAWDMLHGNLLLHGWTLSDVSFYTTELPQYMLIELVHGLHANVVHVAAAMTYTLAVLLAALLAKGQCTGREALVRVLIAAGIMLAPQLSSGVNVLLSSPDHIGTSVPVMVVWLILDHARPRWYIPVIAGLLLGWAQVADLLVLYIGVVPLVLVCVVRVGRAVAVGRQRLASQWYDLALAGAALAGAAAAMLALHLIQAHGGFVLRAPPTRLAPFSTVLHRDLGSTGDGLLLLGGADFLTASTIVTVLHLVGVLLAAWGIWLAAWRFLRDNDRVAQLLVTAIVINLVAYALSTKAHTVGTVREIAPVLPFSAALAGRLVARRLLARRWLAAGLVPVLLIVLGGYLSGLVYEIRQPSVPAQDQQLTSWLVARHLHTGLSGYWESNIVTVTSGGRVQVRMVALARGRLVPARYESKAAWYDPGRAAANFVVLSPGVPGYPGFTSAHAVRATFGRAVRTYDVGPYQVLVWHRNLLRELR